MNIHFKLRGALVVKKSVNNTVRKIHYNLSFTSCEILEVLEDNYGSVYLFVILESRYLFRFQTFLDQFET